MPRRRRAREVAFQVVYQDDLNPNGNPGELDAFVGRRLDDNLAGFARELIAGVRRHRAEIDARLTELAQHWSLGRMAATDRNILRLGAFEILHTDTPDRVAVNEAVEMAKRYGTERSARFVNGLLDRVMHGKESGASPLSADR